MAAFTQAVKPGLDSEWEEIRGVGGGSEVALGQVISWSAAPAPPSARHACFRGQFVFFFFFLEAFMHCKALNGTK